MTRVTITEIAAQVGVSKSAVSYALNGRPGLAPSTRERILQVAGELGWTPNRTARLLSGSRTDAVGLVLSRPAQIIGTEPFFMRLIAGLQSVLANRQYTLVLQLAANPDEELAIYRTWYAERRVDAVVVLDVRVHEPRLALLEDLGLPAVVLADPSLAGNLSCVWTDDAAAIRMAVDYLVGLGHSTIARVAGDPELGHVRIRDDAFATAVAEHGVHGEVVHATFASTTSAAADLLLNTAQSPTAVVFDNDLMAVASLSALGRRGLGVPETMSLLTWDDSELCRLTQPTLSAIRHDVAALGAAVAEQLLTLVDTGTRQVRLAENPELVARESTAAPPTAKRLGARGGSAG